ncbi:hypothetical protein ACRAWD_11450 [Caulobacter segnis]
MFGLSIERSQTRSPSSVAQASRWYAASFMNRNEIQSGMPLLLLANWLADPGILTRRLLILDRREVTGAWETEGLD